MIKRTFQDVTFLESIFISSFCSSCARDDKGIERRYHQIKRKYHNRLEETKNKSEWHKKKKEEEQKIKAYYLYTGS